MRRAASQKKNSSNDASEWIHRRKDALPVGSVSNLSGRDEAAGIGGGLAFKLMKKIAQLTKVIYYLNSKSEDDETQIECLKDAYEQEIANVPIFLKVARDSKCTILSRW